MRGGTSLIPQRNDRGCAGKGRHDRRSPLCGCLLVCRGREHPPEQGCESGGLGWFHVAHFIVMTRIRSGRGPRRTSFRFCRCRHNVRSNIERTQGGHQGVYLYGRQRVFDLDLFQNRLQAQCPRLYLFRRRRGRLHGKAVDGIITLLCLPRASILVHANQLSLLLLHQGICSIRLHPSSRCYNPGILAHPAYEPIPPIIQPSTFRRSDSINLRRLIGVCRKPVCRQSAKE